MFHFMNSIEMGTVWLCAYLLILAYELFMVYLINFCSQRNFSYFSFRQSVQPEHGQMNEPWANDSACGHVSIKRGAQLDQPCLSLSFYMHLKCKRNGIYRATDIKRDRQADRHIDSHADRLAGRQTANT